MMKIKLQDNSAKTTSYKIVVSYSIIDTYEHNIIQNSLIKRIKSDSYYYDFFFQDRRVTTILKIVLDSKVRIINRFGDPLNIM